MDFCRVVESLSVSAPSATMLMVNVTLMSAPGNTGAKVLVVLVAGSYWTKVALTNLQLRRLLSIVLHQQL